MDGEIASPINMRRVARTYDDDDHHDCSWYPREILHNAAHRAFTSKKIRANRASGKATRLLLM